MNRERQGGAGTTQGGGGQGAPGGDPNERLEQWERELRSDPDHALGSEGQPDAGQGDRSGGDRDGR
jgi:hypothetical protein